MVAILPETPVYWKLNCSNYLKLAGVTSLWLTKL